VGAAPSPRILRHPVRRGGGPPTCNKRSKPGCSKPGCSAAKSGVLQPAVERVEPIVGAAPPPRILRRPVRPGGGPPTNRIRLTGLARVPGRVAVVTIAGGHGSYKDPMAPMIATGAPCLGRVPRGGESVSADCTAIPLERRKLVLRCPAKCLCGQQQRVDRRSGCPQRGRQFGKVCHVFMHQAVAQLTHG